MVKRLAWSSAVWRVFGVALVMVGWLIAPALSQAQQADGIVLNARLGFDGYYKEGTWVPVRVIVENNGPDVRGQLRIENPGGFGGGATVFTRDVELPTQSRREIFLYIAPEGLTTHLEVALVDGQTPLAQPAKLTPRLVNAADLLYGVLASSASAFSPLINITPFNGAASLAILEPGDLPPALAAWQGLDVLVISDVDTGALSLEQRSALTNWVHSGGRLLVAGGPSWQKTAAGLGSLLPLAPSGTQTLDTLDDLAAYAEATAPVGRVVIAVGALAPDAVVSASADETPMVALRRVGFGQVAFLAADPALAPLKGWDGTLNLLRKTLSTPVDRPSWSAGLTNASSARDAVETLPSLQLPSPLLICGFLGLYLVIIGPANYFVLRWFKRRELAWFTIPGVVLVFSLTAYIVGFALSGDRPILHQLSVVQAWPGLDTARVDQVVGLFSPRRATYDVDFAPGFLVRPASQLGGPGSGSGSVRIEQSDRPRLYGVRTDIASLESFVATGRVAAPRIDAQLNLKLAGGFVTLEGTVVNQSNLTLEEAVLLAPGGTVRLNRFAPGETRNVSLALSNARAASAPQNAVVPFTSPGSGIRPPVPYYANQYDSTVDDILGTSSYYQDRELYRKYLLLTSAINSYSGGSRGAGVYLVGWTSSAPADAAVVGGNFQTLNQTVYLIALPAAVNLNSAAVTLSPGFMTWTPLALGQTSGSASPYDISLYANEVYSLRFQPLKPVTFQRVQALTLHLFGASYGANSNLSPRLELWNYAQNNWEALATASYGDTAFIEPERYVGPGGEIQVRVSNPSGDTINLTTLDFTLTVER